MNDKKIDISVIVAIYNIECYIEDCLNSILNQEGVKLECICVDDASTDNSYSILSEYAKKDERVKIIHNEQNAGLASSRNKGLKSAAGKYLYIIDGDDYLLPGALKRLFDCAEANQLDLLGFSAIAFLDDESMKPFFEGKDEYVRKGNYSDVMKGSDLFVQLFQNNDRATSNIVLYFFNKKFFEKNDLYAIEGLRYADDSMFSIYMSAQRAMCIPDQLYMRRYRANSACTSPMKKCYLESLIVLFLEELHIWQDSNLDLQANKVIEKYFDMRQKEIRAFYYEFRNNDTETVLLNSNVMAKYFYKYFIEQIPLYRNCFSEAELREIKSAEILILYGAGYIASETAKILEYFDIQNYIVAVTDKMSGEKKFRGREVYNISELKNYAKEACVLVAVSKSNFDAIMQTLNTLEFQNIQWVTLE